MQEYLKKFIFFIILTIVAALIFRMALPKTFDVHIIGDVSTKTGVTGAVNANVSGTMKADVSGAVNANVSGDVNADVSGSVTTDSKIRF